MNNSMILCIAPTGGGKTCCLMNYLFRKIQKKFSSEKFTEIIICSFSTTDEPLCDAIKDENPDMELINNIDDVP